MVGIFSRFSLRGHRRTQSALDVKDVLPPSSEAASATVAPIASGIEFALEFKPVECPSEPLDNDQPIQCPLPEPSILNDGRIWKERVSSGVQRRTDVAVMQEQQVSVDPLRKHPTRVILPSVSAPEHNILKLLDECNAASGI